jgi:hypothetical protein
MGSLDDQVMFELCNRGEHMKEQLTSFGRFFIIGNGGSC